MNEHKPHGRTEWDFWALAFKVAVPLGSVVGLYVMARMGDIVATIALGVVGAVMLIGLGIFTALAILDRAAAREQARFQANVKENLAIADQVSRLQNRQMTGLARQNRDLLRQATEAERLASGQRPTGGLDIDALFTDWEIETVDADNWISGEQH